MAQEFILKIAGSYSPSDIPMTRLGEYLSAFGALLGEVAHVHFQDIRLGSTELVAAVDHVAVPKVANRVRRISAGECGEEEHKAYRRIDDMLQADNATGNLIGTGENVIHVDFQGRNRPEPLVYGPVKQMGTVDGEIIRVEGKDDTVHVGIVDGSRTYSLEAPAARGQELASHFRSGTIRFTGEGTWFRQGDGKWLLKRFKVESFAALDNSTLTETLAGLRKVGIGDWKDVADPLAELAGERGGNEVRH